MALDTKVSFFFVFLIFRPPWTPEMSVEELDANEKQAFLNWRRMLVRLAFLFYPILMILFLALLLQCVCYNQIIICPQMLVGDDKL